MMFIDLHVCRDDTSSGPGPLPLRKADRTLQAMLRLHAPTSFALARTAEPGVEPVVLLLPLGLALPFERGGHQVAVESVVALVAQGEQPEFGQEARYLPGGGDRDTKAGREVAQFSSPSLNR